VQDAVTAAQEAAMRDAIEQAVEDGNLTREHADWLLEGLENGFLGGDHGMGRPGGCGRGGFHGRGAKDTTGFHGLHRFPAHNAITGDSDT